MATGVPFNSTVTSTTEIRNPAGVLADPDTVEVTRTSPTGVKTVDEYNPGSISRVSQGVYRVSWTASEMGYWMIEWAGVDPTFEAYTEPAEEVYVRRSGR